jgi:hypothetical protein
MDGVASVVGDPFIKDRQGKTVQFFLPVHTEAKLLACEGFQLYGSTKPSSIAGDHQQWFEKFRVVIGGETALIGLRNETESPSSNLTTIAVAVAGTKIQKPTGVMPFRDFSMEVKEQSVDIITAAGSQLQVKSASASKFLSSTMQALHMHLDISFPALDTAKCSEGVFAELWGQVPMSKATSAMLEPPKA